MVLGCLVTPVESVPLKTEPVALIPATQNAEAVPGTYRSPVVLPALTVAPVPFQSGVVGSAVVPVIPVSTGSESPEVCSETTAILRSATSD